VLIVRALLHYSAIIEGDTVVVLDRCVAFIGQFDLAATKSVNLLRLQLLLHALRCLVKPCRLDQSPLAIYQIDVHKGTLATGIIPASHLGLFDDACFDSPICRELIESFDRHESIRWDISACS